ncbi:hypothetical protein [Streptomyces sp. ODS28]|uniref:hypothetical protein n=1 Tax=Streptomyces sp. ODS28 TaxID=3136688 RepID=UPI0031ED7DBB
MNANSPSGFPLFLILTGALVTIAAVITRWVTGIDELNYVVATGCFVQCAGWTLHSRRNRRQQR